MSQELSTEISPEIINSLILTGDMSALKPAQQTQYYNSICQLIGISPLTQPFAIIVYQGKKTLYARKDCAQQLCNTRKISTEITKTEKDELVYTTHVRATMPDGRKTDDIGSVGISGVKGQDLANLYMKSATKAKRRAVLALCGLGMPDESEVEDFNPTPQADTSKSKVEKIVNQVEEAQVTKAEVKEDGKKETKKTDSGNKQAPTEQVVAESVEKVNETTGTLPQGHHQIQGIITSWKCLEIGDEKRPKWVFTCGDLKLGTFDADLSLEICKVMDLQRETPILLNIEYKERETTPGKFVKDIVKFSQAVYGRDVLI